MALARLAERARVFWSSNEGVGSNPTSDIKFLRFSALTLKYAHVWGKIRQDSTPGGTRTLNPRFRRPMPYPLGHRGGARPGEVRGLLARIQVMAVVDTPLHRLHQ